MKRNRSLLFSKDILLILLLLLFYGGGGRGGGVARSIQYYIILCGISFSLFRARDRCTMVGFDVFTLINSYIYTYTCIYHNAQRLVGGGEARIIISQRRRARARSRSGSGSGIWQRIKTDAAVIARVRFAVRGCARARRAPLHLL